MLDNSKKIKKEIVANSTYQINKDVKPQKCHKIASIENKKKMAK